MQNIIQSVTDRLAKKFSNIEREIIQEKVHDAVIRYGYDCPGKVYNKAWQDIVDWYRINVHDKRKKKHVEKRGISLDMLMDNPDHTTFQPSTVDATDWAQYNLASFIETLPEKEKAVIVGKYVHGLSMREIATQQGISSIGTIEFFSRNGLSRLRKMLTDE